MQNERKYTMNDLDTILISAFSKDTLDDAWKEFNRLDFFKFDYKSDVYDYYTAICDSFFRVFPNYHIYLDRMGIDNWKHNIPVQFSPSYFLANLISESQEYIEMYETDILPRCQRWEYKIDRLRNGMR